MRVRCPAWRLAALLILLLSPAGAENWPQFRGPTGQGASAEKELPLTWGGPGEQNVRWKAELPKAHNPWSSPIVWGDRVFLTTSTFDPPEHRVLCFGKEDGRLLWSTPVPAGPLHLTDTRATYCAPTPATDGKAVFVAFGSAVVAALDFDGRILWRQELARRAFDVAMGSSPILYKGNVLLLCDQNEGKSCLLAFDKATGKIAWEALRPQQAFAHTTPVLISVKGAPQLLVGASNVFQGLDPENGKPIWWFANAGDTASPAYADGIAYCDSGRGGPGAAVDATGTGDVTATHLKWRLNMGGEVLSSPIIVGGLLYRLRGGSRLSCLELATGKECWSDHLPGVHSWPSPVAAADGRIYFASAGKSFVLRAGPKFELLATNDLGDPNPASPAVSDGMIFLRGNRYLYCIGGKRR